MPNYENAFPGGIGFVNVTTEIFVIKENPFYRWFCPHFYLYNHKTNQVQRYCFNAPDNWTKDTINFLNTIRPYSLNTERYILMRTYYEDLIAEWEINNKMRIRRRFILK